MQAIKKSVKKWYLDEYPSDREEGSKLKSGLTFAELWARMQDGEEFYDIAFNGFGDSIIRERIFGKLAEILKVDYDVIYETWRNYDPEKRHYYIYNF